MPPISHTHCFCYPSRLANGTGSARRYRELGEILVPRCPLTGGAIAFIRAAHGLFLQEVSQDPGPKGQPVRLTSGNQYTASPAWTADGRAIVFSSGTPHRPTLYKVVLSRPEWRAAKPE